MPAGDGTGPIGLGPMTGRAAGYCAGYPVPGYMNPYGGMPAYGRAPWFPGYMGYSGTTAYGGGWYPTPYVGGGFPYYGRGAFPLYGRRFLRGGRFISYGRGGRGRGRW